MQHPAAHENWTSEQFARIQKYVVPFEQAWSRAAPQVSALELAPFLPEPGDPLRLPVLHELIKIDLEIRWRRGHHPQVEGYLQSYRELGTAGSLSVALIFEEYWVRHHYGDHPPLTLYRQRFPRQYEELIQRINDQPLQTFGTKEKTPLPPQKAPSGLPQSPGNVLHPPTSQVRVGTAGETIPAQGYRWIKRIGKGSFGEVWRAEAPGSVEVAIKIILQPMDQEAAQRELSSLETIKALRHPYLLQTQAFWQQDERLIIVMELADGSLRDRLKAYREQGVTGIPVDELLRYFHQAAEALDFLHEKGVQHRDIKPDNILSQGRYAKVADFGLVRSEVAQSTHATMSGTAAYMAPEIWREQLSPHSDQYSLAVTYAELRMGRLPFAGRSMAAMYHAHLEQTPELEPLPAPEQQVLLKALAKKSQERYPSCVAFVQALELAVMPPPPPPSPRATLRQVRKGLTVRSTLDGKLDEAALEEQETPEVEALADRGGTVSRRRWLGWLLVPVVLALLGGGIWFWITPPVPALVLEALPPVVVATGETQTFTVRIRRRPGFGEPVTLRFGELPPGVTIPETTLEGDAECAEVSVTALPTTPSGHREVTIQVEAEQGSASGSVGLTVVFLPSHWKVRDPTPVGDFTGKYYFKSILCPVPVGEPIPFVLVPKRRQQLQLGGKKPDLRSFYIMVNKVSVAQYTDFVMARPELISDKEWPKSRNANQPRKPVLGMKVEDASNFARQWLKGDLPTIDQWEKAAGLYSEDYEARRGEGPYRGEWTSYEDDWKPQRRPQIAVNRGKLGPMDVGEAVDDVSEPFGCRDMAGNGQELTRNVVGTKDKLVSPEKFVPLAEPGDARVHFVGRSYTAPNPVMYKYLGDPDRHQFEPPLKYQEPDPETGFRVVIELQSSAQ